MAEWLKATVDGGDEDPRVRIPYPAFIKAASMYDLYKMYEISNDEYHKKLPLDQHHFSSSQLKELLKDPEDFKTKNIDRKLEDDRRNPAFDIGTYFHTAVLEPHLLDDECIVWKGGRRSGKLWQEFQVKHEKKAILTIPELVLAENLIKGVEKNDVAWDLIDHPDATEEYSLFGKILGIPVKVRLDTLVLGKDKSYIADLKSTTGNVRDVESLKAKISKYGYDLSAALYMDLVNDYIDYNKLPFAHITDFYLIFATKDYPSSKVYRLYEGGKGIAVGRAKYERALTELKKHIEQDWTFPSEQ